MVPYLRFFFDDGGQFIVLASVLAVWAGLAIIGGAIAGRERLAEGDPLYGWAAVSVLFTALGTIAAVPFTLITWGVAALVPLAAVYLYRRERRLFTPDILKVAILALPLLLLASAMVASQWDEFSHWVPTVRFLVETDGFPDAANPVTGGSFPAYPYGWPLLSYMACRLAGRFLENPGSLFNVLLLITFGLVAVRLLAEGAGKLVATRLGWGLCAGAVLAGTLFNPSFAQKVALTAYADVSSAVATAFAAVLGWMMLGAIAEGQEDKARRLAWQCGLALLVLINIKQANLVLVVMLVGGIGVAGLRDPFVRLADLLRMLPRMILPALLIYGLWRYHVVTQLSPADEALLQPFAQWNFDLMGRIFLRMLLVASKKGVFFAIMALAVVFAVRGMIRFKGPLDRLAIVIACVFLGYNAFLFFIYVAHHGEPDALRVASFWRYNMHLGLLAVAFAAYGLGQLWKRYAAQRAVPGLLTWLAVVLVLAAPAVFAHKLRFDMEPPKPHFRAVGRELPQVMPEGSRVFLFDPRGSGESGVITKFHLGPRKAEYRGYYAAFDPFTAANVRILIASTRPTHLLAHSTSAALQEGIGLELAEDASHLLEKGADGKWRLVRSWPYPDDMK